MDEKNPYLSGCVFYLLLRTAAYAGTTARQRRNGMKDDHKNPIFMSDLVYTFTGVQTKIASSDISVYKEGDSEGAGYMPFNDPSAISAFDYAVRNRYPDVLTRMCEFVDWHLNPDKREWLVKACLDIIENDEDILESDVFCVKSNGTFLSKAEIRNETMFEYQPFLIGVLHYILTKRSNKNYLGVRTLDANTDKVKYKERKYRGSLGDCITRLITVNFYEKTEDTLSTSDVSRLKGEETVQIVKPDELVEKSDDEVINDHMIKTAQTLAAIMGAVETPEINTDAMAKGVSIIATALEAQKHQLAEQIRTNSRQESQESRTQIPEDDVASEQVASGDKNTTVIQQQTNVIQNGDNNVNVTNNGTINFNF